MIRKLLLGVGFTGAASVLLVFVAGACSTSKPSAEDADADAGEEDGGGPGPCPQLEFPTTCPDPPPSWKNDVHELIVNYCDQCHGPGGQAFAQAQLGSYSEVYANRTRAWVQIEECLMPNVDGSPPPLAYPTPAERQTMVTWLDVCNAPDN